MEKLTGKVAVITGGARGIGKQMALTLAREGADIVIADLIDMSQAAAEVKNLGRKALTVKTDVTKKEQVENLFATTIENFKQVDILVNDAGISRQGSVLELSEDDWDIVLAVNLKGVFLCSQAAARRMIERKYGKIVNIASVSALSSRTYAAANYQCSKAGVIQLTRACAREFGPYGINVNAIAPGLVHTDITSSGRSEEVVQRMLDETKKATPLGRLALPQDMANLALFLASDDSSFITGQVIAVDGGKG